MKKKQLQYLFKEILRQHLLWLGFPFLLKNPEFTAPVTSPNSSVLLCGSV